MEIGPPTARLLEKLLEIRMSSEYGGFEWDAAKALANRRDHGVSFEDAVLACCDPFAVERVDEREDYGEERINLIGMCNGVVLHVTYTQRGSRTRIISARRAERHEQDDYFRENSA